MPQDLNDDDDMALNAVGGQVQDDDLDDESDVEACFDNTNTDADILTKAVTGPADKEDIIHSHVRRTIEALQELRQLREALSDELDDFDFDESHR